MSDRPMRVSGGVAAARTVQPDEKIVWTGKLYRGEQDGTVRGWLYNHHTGVRIEFDGHRDPRPNTGYLLIGKRVATE